MRISLRYLLPVLLVVVGGGWWFFSSRPPIPAEVQTHNPPAVSKTPSQRSQPSQLSQPSQEKVAPPAPQSGTLPSPRLTPQQGAAPTAIPGPEEGAASRAQNADALEEEPVDDGDVDNLETRLAAIGFSAQDIERIMEIVFAPPVGELTGEDESPEATDDINAPGLDELADDFRARFTAAGFSPKDIERILEVVLAPPADVFPEEDEAMEDVQEPSLDELAEDFQDRLMADGFPPQDIARILQAILAPVASGSPQTTPGGGMDPAHLRDSLLAAGFSPQEIAQILQTLLRPEGQQ